MYVENDLERGNNSTVTGIHFERLFKQQLICLQNSLSRVHTLIEQVEKAAASVLFRELLKEYLGQIEKEKERSTQLLTALHINPYFVRNDIIEGFALELKKLSHAIFENNSLRDAGYCLQLNRLMHYLISFYDSLKELAHVLHIHTAIKYLKKVFMASPIPD